MVFAFQLPSRDKSAYEASIHTWFPLQMLWQLFRRLAQCCLQGADCVMTSKVSSVLDMHVLAN